MTTSTSKKFGRFKKVKAYRSGLEDRVAEQLESLGVPYEYEKHKLKYQIPARTATYTPDFKIGPIFVETKGYFEVTDRQKMALIKEQFPDLDIRMVFSNSKSPIRKGSKTSYAKWCDDHGIPWADKLIPQAWIDEAND